MNETLIPELRNLVASWEGIVQKHRERYERLVQEKGDTAWQTVEYRVSVNVHLACAKDLEKRLDRLAPGWRGE